MRFNNNLSIQYVTLVPGWGGGMAVWIKYTEQINPGGIFSFAIGGTDAVRQAVRDLDEDPGAVSLMNKLAARQRLRWPDVRRFVHDAHGGYLSTRARPSTLDAFRAAIRALPLETMTEPIPYARFTTLRGAVLVYVALLTLVAAALLGQFEGTLRAV